MYSIVVTNGKIINAKATDMEWSERMIKIVKDGQIVTIDVDNIVRWIYAG